MNARRLALASLAVALLRTARAGADEPKRSEARRDPAVPVTVLRDFLHALEANDTRGAYALVAPSTKERGDPIAYRAAADYASFVSEVERQSPGKFGAYELGAVRPGGCGRRRVWVHFSGGDNDEVLMIREGGRWYVGDPIHIIR